MDLSVDLGAGASNLKLAGLELTGLDLRLGAGVYTLDLSGDWARNLDVTINTGAANITLRLPRDVGARVQVERGPNMIEATGLTQDGNVYTNAAYGVSGVTVQVDMEAGIGQIKLEVEEAAAASDYSPVAGELSQLVQTTAEEAGITGPSLAFVDDRESISSEGFGYADESMRLATRG